MKNKKEIDQTQILNLQEIQENSQIEKKAKKSKLIPVLLLLIGIFLIGCGVFLAINTPSTSLNSDNNKNSGQTQESDETNQTNDTNTLTCTIETSLDGLTAKGTGVFTFHNKLLDSYDITTSMSAPAGDETLGATLALMYQTIDSLHQSLAQIDGYTGTTSLQDNTYHYNLAVDLKVFDHSKIPAGNENIVLNMNYKYQQPYDEVKSGLEAQGYTCK